MEKQPLSGWSISNYTDERGWSNVSYGTEVKLMENGKERTYSISCGQRKKAFLGIPTKTRHDLVINVRGTSDIPTDDGSYCDSSLSSFTERARVYFSEIDKLLKTKKKGA